MSSLGLGVAMPDDSKENKLPEPKAMEPSGLAQMFMDGATAIGTHRFAFSSFNASLVLYKTKTFPH